MVKDSSLKTVVVVDNATIDDILTQIRMAESEGADFITPEFIDHIEGANRTDTYYNLWRYVRDNVRYIEDGESQVIKSPGALIKTGYGDCKSMTVFVASVLQKMGHKYDLIVDFYNPDTPNQGHIYVKSGNVIIDPVNPKFNRKDPAYRQKKIKGYSGRVGARIGSTSTYLRGLDTHYAGQRVVLDQKPILYTQMTDGELAIKLAERQYRLFYAATGNENLKQSADYLESVLNTALSGTKTINGPAALKNWAQSKLHTRNFPAVSANYHTGLGNLISFGDYRKQELQKCEEIKKEWESTSWLKFRKRKELRQSWESCFSAASYLGTVNRELEKSAHHLLYNFSGGNSTQRIATKAVLHRIAVENYSKVFGLSRENVDMWIRNGVIAQNMAGGAGSMTPENTIRYMLENYPANADKIGAGPLVVIPAILKIIVLALAATQAILSAIKAEDRQKLLANTQGLDTASFGPEKDDFIGELQDSGAIWPLAAALAAVVLIK